MDFDYSPDQRALQGEARRFLAAACPVSAVRLVLDDAAVRFDRALWRRVAEQGWLGAAVPEAYGGLGLGSVELGALSEELGRTLAPIPFASTAYILTQALLLAGSAAQKSAWLPRIAAGKVIGCGAFAEGPGTFVPVEPRTRVRDRLVSGVKIPVVDGSIADVAVVLAEGDAGPVLGLVALEGDCVRRDRLETLDPTCDVARLTFDEAPFEALAAGGDVLDVLLDRAAILYALQQLGGADRCLEMATEHAKTRHAFGQKIGQFQALKHKLADILVANTLARSHAFRGLWALDAVGADLPAAAAAARLSAGEAYWIAARETIHTYGAMGFTWDADPHLYYRRAHHLSMVLGGPERWHARLFDSLRVRPPTRAKGDRFLI
jgi:alkylation response protein AidB-like acyl-CoA dehydrogenase